MFEDKFAFMTLADEFVLDDPARKESSQTANGNVPVFTMGQMAHQLTPGDWGGNFHAFDAAPDSFR